MDALTNRGTSGLLLVGLVVVGLGSLHPAGAAPAALDPYPYVSRLRAPRAAERARAARILGYLGTEQQVPALADVLLRDRGRDPRTAAAVALGQIGGEAAAAALSTELLGLLHGREPIPTTDGGWAYLEAVVGATGLAGGEQALAPLKECAASAEPRLRALALAALGAQGSEEALGLVAAALGDPDADCRVRAARVLGAHGTAGQVPQLVAALRAATDDVWAVETLDALAHIPDPTATAGLAAGAELPLPLARRRAAAQIGALAGPEMAPLLEKLCEDPAALVHEGALPALATVAPERARARLAAAVQAADAPTVRGACLAAAVMDEVAVAEELARVALAGEDETAGVARQALCALSACDVTSKALVRLLEETSIRRGDTDLLWVVPRLLAVRSDPVAAEYSLRALLAGPRSHDGAWRDTGRVWATHCADDRLARCAETARLSTDAEVGDRALRMLAMTGSDEALELLRAAAGRLSGPAAAAALGWALMDCPRPEATDLLLEVMSGELPELDRYLLLDSMAKRDLRCLAYVAAKAADRAQPDVLRRAAREALGTAWAERTGPAALLPPRERAPSPEVTAAREALIALFETSESGEPVALLLRAVAGDELAVRGARRLMGLDDAWGTDGVKPQVSADDADAGLAAASVLPPAVGVPMVRDFLARLSQWRTGQPTWCARGWNQTPSSALWAATQLRDSGALPYVVEALGDTDCMLRETALESLGVFAPDEAGRLLARAARESAADDGDDVPRPRMPASVVPPASDRPSRGVQRTVVGLDDKLVRGMLARHWLSGRGYDSNRPSATMEALAEQFEARGRTSQAERARRWAAWEASW